MQARIEPPIADSGKRPLNFENLRWPGAERAPADPDRANLKGGRRRTGLDMRCARIPLADWRDNLPGRQAKILTPSQIEEVLKHLRKRKDWLRSRVIFLLSIRSGLRAKEIGLLCWEAVLSSTGDAISHTIEIEDKIAKKGHGGNLPMHPELRSALVALLRRTPRAEGPIIRSRKGRGRKPMASTSIQNWFRALYTELGYFGCTSHSGRRTYITQAARALSQVPGASLRDVQMLARHSSLHSTEVYIQQNSYAQRKLISLL